MPVQSTRYNYSQEVLNNAKLQTTINNTSESTSAERRSRPQLPSNKQPRPDQDEYWEDGNQETFQTEVLVVANAKKLLLATCIIIASRNSEILKTGSSSEVE